MLGGVPGRLDGAGVAQALHDRPRAHGVLVGQRAHDGPTLVQAYPAPHHRSDEAPLGRPVDAVKTAVTQAEAEAETRLFPQGAVALGGQGKARGSVFVEDRRGRGQPGGDSRGGRPAEGGSLGRGGGRGQGRGRIRRRRRASASTRLARPGRKLMAIPSTATRRAAKR